VARRKQKNTSGEQAAGGLRVPSAFAAAFFLLWVAVLWHFYRKHNVRLDPAVWADFFLLVPDALGRFPGPLAAKLAWLAAFWATAAGLGAGTLSIALFCLGLARFTPGLLKACFIAAFAAALLAAPWWLRSLAGEPGDYGPRGYGMGGRPLGGWALAALALLGCAALMSLLGTLPPEIFYDSLVYHLALPKLYLLRGRIVPTVHNIYSGLPLGVQMLYGLSLSLSDDRLAALLHASFGLWAAASVYVIGRRHFSSEAGAFAAFAFTLCPIALYAGWNCGVDLASAFYCALSLLALLKSLDRDEPGEALRWAACSGLLAGFAAGTKYNVLPVALILVLLHAWHSRRLGRPLKGSAAMACAAALAFSPWIVKNMLFFGNPVYPFLTGTLGGGQNISDWRGFLEASSSRGLRETFSSWAAFQDLLLQPWICCVGDWPLGDWPGPVFILLIPLAFFMRLESVSEKVAAQTAAAGYLAWALASRLVRYVLPSLPALALCVALVIRRGTLPRWLRHAAWAAALYAGLFDFQAAYNQGAAIGEWRYSRGRISAADYLNAERVTYGLPYYTAAQFINRELPKDARVLVLGESRTFYIERDVVASTVFDNNPFWLAARDSKTPEELLAKVQAMGITHVFLNAEQLVYRAQSAAVMPRDVVGGPVFRVFWGKYLRQLFEDRKGAGGYRRWLTVYEVRSSPNPPDQIPVNPAFSALSYLEKGGQ